MCSGHMLGIVYRFRSNTPRSKPRSAVSATKFLVRYSQQAKEQLMSDPYVGEIRMFGGNFPPMGWAFCDGSILSIAENDVLFSLIGTTYGGDGQTTFALPDLRGRIPIHQGNGFILAETGGAEEITLTVSQIPAHTHPWLCSSSAA